MKEIQIKCKYCKRPLKGWDNQEVIQCMPKGPAVQGCWGFTETGVEKRIRKELEARQGQLRYPRAAVARAIDFSSDIYRLATHDERIDTHAVEKEIAKTFGASASADRVRMLMIAGRGFDGMSDSRAGVVAYEVSGRHAASPVLQLGLVPEDWSLLYIVFRGSRGSVKGEENPMGAGWDQSANANLDWRANFTNAQVKPAWRDACKVHEGFYSVYSSMRNQIKLTVDKAMAKNSRLRIITTGHSLGAALATLCAHDLHHQGREPMCFTFCSPRVGDQAFARDFNANIGDKWGVVPGESTGAQVAVHPRCFVFVQGDDPVSRGSAHGFRFRMSDESARDVADSGNILKQGMFAARKDQSVKDIFYHVRNMWQVSFFGEHRFEVMRKALHKT